MEEKCCDIFRVTGASEGGAGCINGTLFSEFGIFIRRGSYAFLCE